MRIEGSESLVSFTSRFPRLFRRRVLLKENSAGLTAEVMLARFQLFPHALAVRTIAFHADQSHFPSLSEVSGL
jgi:hypothetical protein